ncbi:MAG: hypothetical protein AB2705_21155 [Candidatus Thiodiazotropha sp.]
MPKSQADKPPRFEYCDVHPKQLKDVFCCEHKILLCALCSSSDHKGCSIKTVQDACGVVNVSKIGALYDKIKTLQENLKSALPSIKKDVDQIKDQQKTMLRDAQMIYDQMLARLNKLYNDIKKEIQTRCQSKLDRLSHQHKKYNGLFTKLDSPLVRLEELQAIPIDTKEFLRLQEIVSDTKKLTAELQDSHEHRPTSLTFTPSQQVQEILSSSFTFGKIRSSDSKSDADIVIPEIVFPVSTLKQVSARPKTGKNPDPQRELRFPPRFSKPAQQLSKMKATKQGTYDQNLIDDARTCCITGLAITKDRRFLSVDYSNIKVKMFSHDMKLLSSVTVPDKPYDIAVITDKEAVVTTLNYSLVILDISGSQLSIKTTTQLPYDVHGISKYNNKLVVTSPGSNPASVKLIDQTGRVYWSVSSDQQGQPLFSRPEYVSSPGNGRSTTVIVTDTGNNTLTLVNGGTGEVITRHQLKQGKHPKGVTTDSDGNVYVCYYWTNWVAVLSGDLSEEKILLSEQDGLSGSPKAIVYDDEAHRLIISYDTPGFFRWGSNQVDVFQLS